MLNNSEKVVLITGASSGIGKATALLFAQKGWQVVATMRSPAKATDLVQQEGITCLLLDVTQKETIESAIAQVQSQFGRLDVVVNNAGYGLLGCFEGATPAQIQQQFATNLFGLMDVTRAVLPIMRQQGSGVIVNISSIGGRMTLPLFSLYHSSKWAVEGFSESLQYELRPLGIKVKVIEPGPIKTDFYDRSVAMTATLPDYEPFITRIIPKFKQAGERGATAETVAQVIYRASTDNTWQLRYAGDPLARQLLFLRKILPESWFINLVRSTIVNPI